MSCQIVCYCVSNCWQKRTIARCILLTKLESLVEKSGVGGVILLSPTSPPSHTVAVLHSIYGLDLCNLSTLQNWPHSPHSQVASIIFA